MMSEASLSLRERKKAKTRQALIDASQRLFARRGYAETTLDEICNEVDVRAQTLLRYFPSKAHLALAPVIGWLEAFQTHIEDPTRIVDTISIWREVVESRSRSVDRHVLRFHRWVSEEPTLTALMAELDRRFEDVLAAGLARDHGVDEAVDLHSRLVAALLVAGNRALFRRWLEHGADLDRLVANQLAVIEFAVNHLPRDTATEIDQAFAG